MQNMIIPNIKRTDPRISQHSVKKDNRKRGEWKKKSAIRIKQMDGIAFIPGFARIMHRETRSFDQLIA
jgi:hypothetical protein